MNAFPYRFCLITDFRFIPESQLEKIISKAIEGGVDLIQYRDNDSSPSSRLDKASRLRKITHHYNVGFFINRDEGLAKKVDADGIQVGADAASIQKIRSRLGEKKLIGVSVHSEKELLQADRSRADVIILSPLFSPGSKTISTSLIGETQFSKLCQKTGIPVVALGGINENNAHIPIKCGAYGIACITGLLQKKNIYKAAKRMANSARLFDSIF